MWEARAIASRPLSPAATAAIAGAAREIDARVDAITHELMGLLDEQMPELVRDEDLREQTHATARASARLITAMALTWTDPADLNPPHEALQWARLAADRGVSAESLLRTYRLGHARYWELWYDELVAQDADPQALAEATAASSAFFFRWVDAISEPLLQAFEEHRDRRARSTEALRADTVRAILDDAELDQQVAAARLGYELGGWHVAMIAWLDGPVGDLGGTALEAHATELAQRLAGPAARPLLVRDGATALWAWVHGFDPLAEEALDAVAGGAHGPLRVALGRPGRGLEGFRDSHLQARVARRVARLAGDGPAVVRYDDETGVLALLTGDAERARRFVRRTLGPLAAGDEATRRLLDTLRVFQEEGQSFSRTAARLAVHQNTAAYRVRRALELAGGKDASSLALRAAVSLVPLLDRGSGPGDG
ncbi:MAG: helix-turn-helix domain-containing protein [Solirubrobacterales bacterium]|nr:helix-turn-helix domain-containing protein [Solirubrobacterales bacterium]